MAADEPLQRPDSFLLFSKTLTGVFTLNNELVCVKTTAQTPGMRQSGCQQGGDGRTASGECTTMKRRPRRRIQLRTTHTSRNAKGTGARQGGSDGRQATRKHSARGACFTLMCWGATPSSLRIWGEFLVFLQERQGAKPTGSTVQHGGSSGRSGYPSSVTGRVT